MFELWNFSQLMQHIEVQTVAHPQKISFIFSPHRWPRGLHSLCPILFFIFFDFLKYTGADGNSVCSQWLCVLAGAES